MQPIDFSLSQQTSKSKKCRTKNLETHPIPTFDVRIYQRDAPFIEYSIITISFDDRTHATTGDGTKHHDHGSTHALVSVMMLDRMNELLDFIDHLNRRVLRSSFDCLVQLSINKTAQQLFHLAFVFRNPYTRSTAQPFHPMQLMV
ncbi:hypothetical protein X551_01751 [Methylibium sp. T29]|nr:hypothetical protein X551_01751 [Methylibium sp. T29]EWS59694.1 hypothetical protein Y694_02507 [Methylibium sp. T29-B]